MEQVEGLVYRRTVRLGARTGWLTVTAEPGRPALRAEVSLGLAGALPALVSRLRAAFDLDARPDVVAEALAADPALEPSVRRDPGLRVPGALDGFEAAVRVVLGQQVSVAAATTVSGRLAAALGEPVTTPFPGLDRLPATAEAVAAAGEDVLARLGMPGARARTLLALAGAVRGGTLSLERGADLDEVRAPAAGPPRGGAVDGRDDRHARAGRERRLPCRRPGRAARPRGELAARGGGAGGGVEAVAGLRRHAPVGARRGGAMTDSGAEMTGLMELKVKSPLGWLRLLAEEGALVGLYMEEHCPAPPAVLAGDGRSDPLLREAAAQLTAWFAGERAAFELPLRPRGTPFQRAVWQALRAIPPGETRTYGQVAAAVGRPAAVRAVGAAVGRNPLSVFIPCHRVVGAGGTLTGFAGGLARKRWLLEHERRRSQPSTPS